MSFYQKLCLKLNNKLTKAELSLLPRSYQILGKILLLKLKPELYQHKKEIGKAIMDILPYLQSVCLIKEISENTRKPAVEVIAGSGTETVHREYGCKFAMDVSQVMFSKGNKNERNRLVQKVKERETIVDMFAGIGYWSVILAKNKQVKVYAIDINPVAIRYLKKNIELNKLSAKITVLKGNCIDFANLLSGKADRIIVGYLFETEKFLPAALQMAKKNCIIHMHRNIEAEKIEELKKKIIRIGEQNNAKIKVLETRKVKSYAPRILHIAADLQVCKNS